MQEETDNMPEDEGTEGAEGVEGTIEKSQSEIIAEALESARLYANVSGVGSEIGSLSSMLGRCQSGEELSEDDMSYVMLIKTRSDEISASYEC